MIKKFITIFIFIFSLLIIFFVSQNKKIAAQSSCMANSPQELRSCIDQNAQNIFVTSLFNCDVESCAFYLIDKTVPITIQGEEGKVTGLRKTSRYNEPFFYIFNSNNIVIKNIILDHVQHKTFRNSDTPADMIMFIGSQNSVIDNVTFNYAQKIGVSLRKTRNIRIINSKFLNSGLLSIWMENGDIIPEWENRNYKIENNFFKNTGVDAVSLSGKGDPADPSLLRGNIFMHNHRHYTYDACSTNTNIAPCSGTQIFLVRNDNLLIDSNIIIDGSVDNKTADYLSVSGIEINGRSYNIVIINNHFVNNSGEGIQIPVTFLDPGWVSSVTLRDQIKMYDNYFYNNQGINNGTFNYVENFFDLEQLKTINCVNNTACKKQLPKGVIYSDYSVCSVSNSNPTCSNKINWFTYDLGNIKILENQNQISSELISSKLVYLGNSINSYNLYSGNNLISKIETKGDFINKIESFGNIYCLTNYPNTTGLPNEAKIEANWENLDNQMNYYSVCVTPQNETPSLLTTNAEQKYYLTKRLNWINQSKAYLFTLHKNTTLYQSSSNEPCLSTPISKCTIGNYIEPSPEITLPPSPSAPPKISGDANEDQLVNYIDFEIWKTNYNTQTLDGNKKADFNNDQKVNGIDYVIWLTNFK